MKQTIKTHKTFSLTPGGNEVIIELLKRCDIKSNSDTNITTVLIIGSRFGDSAIAIAKKYRCHITGIDDDPEMVMHSKLFAQKSEVGDRIDYKIMSPLQVDAANDSFDIILMEGIFTSYQQQKLLKECSRILKPNGKLTIADSFWRKLPVPQYVRDVWETRQFQIPTLDGWHSIMSEKDFQIVWSEDISDVLGLFYQQFGDDISKMSEDDFAHIKKYKSLLIHYRHEMNVYLKQQGHKWMGYLILVAERMKT